MLHSCEDAYKITQDGEFSDAATFKTLEDLKLYMIGTYAYASDFSEIGITSLITDETSLGSQNAGQDRDQYGFIINTNDTFADDIWLSQYSLINRANRLIEGASRITPTAAELPEYNAIVAQAKCLRAYGHFQLLTFFSPDMKNDNELGCILMDHIPGILERRPRNTNGEVFTFIESDLADAYANIVDYTNGTAPNTKGWTFFSKNAIDAFRARMYEYRGNYTLALQYANQAIAAAPALTIATPVPAPTGVAPNFGAVGTGVPPAGTATATAWATTGWNGSFYNAANPTNPYRRMWADYSQGEVILSFDKSTGKEAIGGLWYFNRTNLTGGPYHELDRNLFNLLEQNNGANGSNDIRRYAFVDATSKVDQAGYPAFAYQAPNYTTDPNYKPNDVLLIDKYPGKTGAELTNDLKIFRTSEMYFIRAEALIAAGDLSGAATALQAVRVARTFRNSPPALPVYASAAAAWADVLYERRLELCFEGHRYIDLKRLGTLAGVGFDRYSRDCEVVGICGIATDDYRFTLPIPLNELTGNTNIQQNPGYAGGAKR